MQEQSEFAQMLMGEQKARELLTHVRDLETKLKDRT